MFQKVGQARALGRVTGTPSTDQDAASGISQATTISTITTIILILVLILVIFAGVRIIIVTSFVVLTIVLFDLFLYDTYFVRG